MCGIVNPMGNRLWWVLHVLLPWLPVADSGNEAEEVIAPLTDSERLSSLQRLLTIQLIALLSGPSGTHTRDEWQHSLGVTIYH